MGCFDKTENIFAIKAQGLYAVFEVQWASRQYPLCMLMSREPGTNFRAPCSRLFRPEATREGEMESPVGVPDELRLRPFRRRKCDQTPPFYLVLDEL
eukprot:6174412-Pleurochrysis_carterae.AAC.3